MAEKAFNLLGEKWNSRKNNGVELVNSKPI